METTTTIEKYIAYRYNNWLDYAKHMARVNHFEGWENDLLNDVIEDLLKKPHAKLIKLLNNRTRKIVNGSPTTELDKFVLSMLHMNSTSKVAPFRKNTLGKKVISHANGKIECIEQVQVKGIECADEGYNDERAEKLEKMHKNNIHRLENNLFSQTALKLYRQHFIESMPAHKFSETEQEKIQHIYDFLTQTKKTLLDG